MNSNSMPYSICKNDNLFGTIVSINRCGVNIRLDLEDATGSTSAFAHFGGKIGQRVLVSVKSFNDRFNNFYVTIDSYLNEVEQIAA